jgi:hypothetical protein
MVYSQLTALLPACSNRVCFVFINDASCCAEHKPSLAPDTTVCKLEICCCCCVPLHRDLDWHWAISPLHDGFQDNLYNP